MPSAECPDAQPSSSSTCQEEGLRCEYEASFAECREGTWDTLAKNPPPSETCPTQRPVEGSACHVPEAEECAYSYCGDYPDFSARCVAGIWKTYEISCNPPIYCPWEPPPAGEPCYEEGPICAYPDDVWALCRDGAWQVTEPGNCPEKTPVEGEVCAPRKEACSYGDCYGEPTIQAACVENLWQVAERTCNPPPPEPAAD